MYRGAALQQRPALEECEPASNGGAQTAKAPWDRSPKRDASALLPIAEHRPAAGSARTPAKIAVAEPAAEAPPALGCSANPKSQARARIAAQAAAAAAAGAAAVAAAAALAARLAAKKASAAAESSGGEEAEGEEEKEEDEDVNPEDDADAASTAVKIAAAASGARMARLRLQGARANGEMFDPLNPGLKLKKSARWHREFRQALLKPEAQSCGLAHMADNINSLPQSKTKSPPWTPFAICGTSTVFPASSSRKKCRWKNRRRRR